MNLILVGGNKGGVGKTTLARLLLHYAQITPATAQVYDGQAPGGSLRRFYPAAELVAFDTTAGRMRVLDNMAQLPTLVDLPAGLLSETLQLLHDTGYMRDVASGVAKLTVVHVLGPNVDSVGEAADVAARMAEGGTHLLVRNCATDEQFDWAADSYSAALRHIAAAATVTVPHLDGTAREAVDRAGGGYTAFIADTGKSSFLRRVVTKWLDDCRVEFDRVSFRGYLQ